MGPTTTSPGIIVVNTAIPKFEKDIVDLTKVKHMPLAFMKERGRVRTGVDGGYEERYVVDYKECPTTGLRHGSKATYEARDYTRWAVMDWRGRMGTDSMHLDEYIKIKDSQTAIVNRYKRIVPKMLTGLRNSVSDAFFLDGSATGNEDEFAGIESCLAAGTGGNACLVGDLVAYPDDTYHELSTQVGQGGTWTTTSGMTSPSSVIGNDWPEGSGDREYHYWSPLLVNWSSNAWGTEEVGWEDNCLRALSRTLMWMRNTQGVTGQIVAVVAQNLMAGFKAVLQSQVRLTQPHAEATRLGFPDALNYEGAAITSGYGIPANTVYLFEVDNVDLMFLTDKIVVTHPVQWEQHDMAYNFLAFTSGNYRFKPKFCAKMFNYAAA